MKQNKMKLSLPQKRVIDALSSGCRIINPDYRMNRDNNYNASNPGETYRGSTIESLLKAGLIERRKRNVLSCDYVLAAQ